jgi:hypothetical protein
MGNDTMKITEFWEMAPNKLADNCHVPMEPAASILGAEDPPILKMDTAGSSE